MVHLVQRDFRPEERKTALNAAPLDQPRLTAREAEVLGWVAHGKSNADVAYLLGLSSRTVQKHLEHIFQKLGVDNRTAAVVRAFEFLSRSSL